jgi:hypothetical protein
MKRTATTLIVLLVALVASVAPARAALRVPQVPVLGGTLQGYLTGVGESINVLTGQSSTQSWTRTVSTTTGFTIQVELTANASLNEFGMYNGSAAVPTLFMLLPGSAGAASHASATFRPGNLLIVSRLDALGNFIGQQTFTGVDETNFGFYVKGPGGTFFSQDFRNPGGTAQGISFQGTAANAGNWWMCFEESSVAAGSDRDFDDSVVLMESVNPTPVNSTSWGQLKARFR